MHSKAVRLSDKEWLDRCSETKQHAQNPSKEAVGLQSYLSAWRTDACTMTQDALRRDSPCHVCPFTSLWPMKTWGESNKEWEKNGAFFKETCYREL